MLNLILFLVVIGVLVFVHESGHFLAAKLMKISVEEFALGFGPKIFSFTKGETVYRINILPFGGYVKMAGEGEYDDENPDPHGFEVQAAWKKLIVLLAGVFMNFLLASLIYTAFMIHYSYSQYIPEVVPNNFPFGTAVHLVSFGVDPTDKTSPLSQYHLNSSYILQAINNKKVYDISSVESDISQNLGKKISLSFTDSNGEHFRTVSVIPRVHSPKGRGAVGIALAPVVKLEFTGIQKPVSGILYAIDMLQYNVSALYTLTVDAVKTHTASVVTNNLTGPVGIYEVTGAVYQEMGIMGLLNIIALLSLALALMNVLPLPVLDGGFALIVVIEAIMRRPLNAKVKAWISNIGVVLLVLLMIYVTFNDINNFNIIQQVKHLFGH